MPRIPFAVQSYKNDDLPADKQRTVNMYAEARPADGTSPVAVIGIPGLVEFGDNGSGGMRGMLFDSEDTLWAVIGAELFDISSTGVGTLKGTILGTGRVQITENADQVGIVTGGTSYIVTKSTGVLSTITDADFPAAKTLAFLDQFGVFEIPQTVGAYGITALNDFSTVDPTDIARAESDPDPLVAVFSDTRQLFLFGRDTIEVWYNSGDAAFPFDPLNNIVMSSGLGAVYSIAKFDNRIIWLDRDGVVQILNEFLPQRISQHSIEDVIAQSDIPNATAFSYKQKGHEFYVLQLASLTAPGVSSTWVYDSTTQLWHERQSRKIVGQSLIDLGRWRAEQYVRAFNKDLVGDFQSGKIYELTRGEQEEDGNTLIALLTSPEIQAEGAEILVNRFEAQFKTGVGKVSGQGVDPVAMLRISNDGGHTFGAQRFEPLGKIGEFTTRVIWDEVGVGTSFVYELSISDPVDRSLVIARANVEVGEPF